MADLIAELRHQPASAFRARLEEQLMRRAMSMTETKPYQRPGLRSLTPYLISKGSARLIEFLKKAFGAEEILRVPAPEGTIMHAELRIGDSKIELSDGNPEHFPTPSCLHLYVPDARAVHERAVAAGAMSAREPVEQPYGDLEAGIQDPSGNWWFVATHRLEPGRYLPSGLRDVTPYLMPADAEAFLAFVKNALGAEEVEVHRGEEEIVHAKVRLGDSILEFSQGHGEWQPTPCALHFYVPDADAVYAKAIAAGASSIFPVSDQPYGDRSGGINDPQGHRWYISTWLGEKT